MHLFTHTKQESLGQAGRWRSPYRDTMTDHDKNVGQMLDYLDELGIADDTFYGAYAIADKWAATFKDFPPVQKPNSFTIDAALAMMSEASNTGR
jgi:hypothetical protein